ncbi:MAG: DUF2934 domain-containing protein, partial [Terracidiphilus sp.]
YRMARKTTKDTSTTRNKNIEISVPPAAVAAAPEARQNDVPKADARKVGGRKNGKPAQKVSGNALGNAKVNLEEEIRRRAYELYLQRKAAGNAEIGDENQDWLMAEREIRSRRSSKGHHAA